VLRLDVPGLFPRPELDASRSQDLVRDLLQLEQLPHFLRQGQRSLDCVQFTLALVKARE